MVSSYSEQRFMFEVEFEEKNKILSRLGKQYDAVAFYEELFGEDMLADHKVMTVFGSHTYRAMYLKDALYESYDMNNAYISPCFFYDDYKKDDRIDYVFAFVVDVDHVKPEFLDYILGGLETSGMMPSFVVNSGKGVHLYYFLKKPLYLNKYSRNMARECYKELNKKFTFKADVHSLGQAYRIVGTLTKIGKRATAFETSENRYTVEEIADFCGFPWSLESAARSSEPAARSTTEATEKMRSYAAAIAERLILPLPDFSNFNETYRFIRDNRRDYTRATSRTKRHGSSNLKSWYNDVYFHVLDETKLGNRYASLQALCVIAWKANIAEDRLDRDLENIRVRWSNNPDWEDDPFNERNIASAKRMYNDKYKTVRRETLEQWLDWKFSSREKKQARPQEEFLDELAYKKVSSTKKKMEEVLMKSPKMSKAEVIRQTGLSKPTVYKYYDEVMKRVNKKKAG